MTPGGNFSVLLNMWCKIHIFGRMRDATQPTPEYVQPKQLAKRGWKAAELGDNSMTQKYCAVQCSAVVHLCNSAQCISTVCLHCVTCSTMVQYKCVYCLCVYVCVCLYFQDQSMSESLIATRLCELDFIWLHLICERKFILHHLAFRT